MRSMKFVPAKLSLGLMAAAIGMAGHAPAAAQNGGTLEGLNIPEDIQLFGNPSDNVYRPTARVNGEIITQTDVDQRTTLFLLSNNNPQLTPEQLTSLKVQIFGVLVDEKLKVQEATANGIAVTDDEVRERFETVANRFGMTSSEFSKYLTERGSSSISLGTQLRAEIAWDRLLGRNVTPFTNVSEEEVRALLDRMQAAKGTAEYRIKEIYLSASPETAQATFENGRRIMEQIRQGGSFEAFARQFSEASTAVVGGDLDYVQLNQLPSSLSAEVAQMQVGQIAGPIEVPGGYSIIYLADMRRILTADVRDAVLSLKQVSLAFPADITPEAANVMAENFVLAGQRLQGCGSVDAFASTMGARVVSRDQIALRELPEVLQGPLATLPVGQMTQPFGSRSEGISFLVLCGREMPQEIALPSASAVEQELLNDKIEKRARRYLRDLRLDALIQYS